VKIQTQPQGNVTLLVPHGPLVSDDMIELRRAIEETTVASARRVVLDMSDVPYLDSAGVELLLELCGVHLPPHQRPTLAALSETCMEALELTDVLARLEAFDTVENAMRSCQR
jgi:anti-anti-sigma factor